MNHQKVRNLHFFLMRENILQYIKTRYMDNITGYCRNNFNMVRNHCSLTTELNLEYFIIIDTNTIEQLRNRYN